MSVLAQLKNLKVGDQPLVTWTLGGRDQTARLRVVKATRASVTLRDATGAATGPWRVKFALVGNEGPWGNKITQIAE